MSPSDTLIVVKNVNEEGINGDNKEPVVLHIVVVGFHHKKGCLVEFSYPSLVTSSSDSKDQCPEAWKNLPSLAMPDGSHNFVEDTVYFHLPSLTQTGKTVFGISSYRQIEAKMLAKKTEDITRSTVQKSVCVLSTQPLYGQIQVKMSLITEAYFREGDFSQYSLLHDAYSNLNQCLNHDLLNSAQALIGIPLRSVAAQFCHKLLVLFKLFLLEKKVLFFHSPVRPLCTAILGILALFPGLVERGLFDCTALLENETSDLDETNSHPKEGSIPHSESSTSLTAKMAPIKEKLINYWTGGVGTAASIDTSGRDESLDNNGISDAQEAKENTKNSAGRLSPSILAELANEECGFPLEIFSDGYLCHPYLSLSYLDLLTEPRVRGYVIGATNVLFKQKRSLFDVIVEIDQCKIDLVDPEMRRLLELSKEDMRFADHISRHVTQDQANTFLEGIGWEGGDDWLRAEFKSYLMYLLRSTISEEGIHEAGFNPFFVQALKNTRHYSKWLRNSHPAVDDLQPLHPFNGQLSMSDVKLKINHLTQTMQSTEKGKKITNAALNTGRAVVQTGKAVGGALSQVKGAFSQWWSGLQSNTETEIAQEAHNDDGGKDVDPRVKEDH